MIGTICLALFVLWIIQHYWEKRRYYKLSSQTLGPFPYPILGNAITFFRTEGGLIQLIKKVGSWYNSTDMIHFWLGEKIVLFVSHPESVETVLNSTSMIDKPERYGVLGEFLGRGLITLNGANWRFHRRLVTPMFASRNIESLMPRFDEKIRIASDQLIKNSNGEKFDILQNIATCSIGIILESLCGEKDHGMNIDRILHSIAEAKHISFRRAVEPWLQFDFIFFRTALGKRLKESIKFFHGSCELMVKNRIKALEKMKANGTLVVPNDESELVIIDELLKHVGDKFTFQDVVEEVVTHLLAGFESTATSLGNIILMLAMSPECQEKVFQELKSIFPEQNSSVTLNDLDKMNYIDNVINESMRLIPIVPFLARKATKDINLRGVLVPAGTEVIIGAINMHRDKAYWGVDAEEFVPERFDKIDLEGEHKYMHIPFSAGQRRCLAAKYAKQQMKVYLAYFIRNYEFSTDEKLSDVNFRADITITMVDGQRVRCKKRELY